MMILILTGCGFTVSGEAERERDAIITTINYIIEGLDDGLKVDEISANDIKNPEEAFDLYEQNLLPEDKETELVIQYDSEGNINGYFISFIFNSHEGLVYARSLFEAIGLNASNLMDIVESNIGTDETIEIVNYTDNDHSISIVYTDWTNHYVIEITK